MMINISRVQFCSCSNCLLSHTKLSLSSMLSSTLSPIFDALFKNLFDYLSILSLQRSLRRLLSSTLSLTLSLTLSFILSLQDSLWRSLNILTHLSYLDMNSIWLRNLSLSLSLSLSKKNPIQQSTKYSFLSPQLTINTTNHMFSILRAQFAWLSCVETR